MPTQARSEGEKAKRRVAASYRKAGYRVTVPPSPETLPPFLLDCHPDLVAERDDDRVVVEIKPAGSLKGSNDLVEMAQRVANQPGWRLELVTFKDTDPDTFVVTAPWLERMLAARQPGSDGAGDVFLAAYRFEVLAFMLRSLSLRAGLPVGSRSPIELANSLAFDGRIHEALLSRIRHALRWQMDLMRGHEPSPPAEGQTAELEAICRELYTQATFSED
jgi:hypothetical protein